MWGSALSSLHIPVFFPRKTMHWAALGKEEESCLLSAHQGKMRSMELISHHLWKAHSLIIPCTEWKNNLEKILHNRANYYQGAFFLFDFQEWLDLWSEQWVGHLHESIKDFFFNILLRTWCKIYRNNWKVLRLEQDLDRCCWAIGW